MKLAQKKFTHEIADEMLAANHGVKIKKGLKKKIIKIAKIIAKKVVKKERKLLKKVTNEVDPIVEKIVAVNPPAIKSPNKKPTKTTKSSKA